MVPIDHDGVSDDPNEKFRPKLECFKANRWVATNPQAIAEVTFVNHDYRQGRGPPAL